jgi:hypothetical protein
MQLVRSVMNGKRKLIAVAMLMIVAVLLMATQPPPTSAAASRLVVDKVQCWVETDESGADDVYMVLFRGFTTAPFSSAIAVRGPGNYWTDFDAGEPWNQDIDIAGWSADSVYLVMLMEQDDGTDVTGGTLNMIKTATAATWSMQMLSMTLANNGGPITAAQQATAAQAVKSAMEGGLGPELPWPFSNSQDSVIETKRIIIAPGQVPSFFFHGEGGLYSVWFKVV